MNAVFLVFFANDNKEQEWFEEIIIEKDTEFWEKL